MVVVALLAKGILAAALLFAAAAKLLDPAATRRALASFGLPEGLQYALPLVEAFTGLGLLVESRSNAAAWVALALLAVFTAVLAVRLSRGRREPCPCFGGTGDRPLDGRAVARNVGLMGLAVLATGATRGPAWIAPAAAAATAGLLALARQLRSRARATRW